MAKADYDAPLMRAIILDDQALTRIFKIIADACGAEPSISFQCIDNTTMRFGSLDEAIAYSNPSHRQIIQATIRLYQSEGPIETCLLQIRKDKDLAPISLQIKGDDTQVLALKRNLLDELRSIEPMYSTFVAHKSFPEFLLSVGVFIAAVTVVLYVGSAIFSKNFSTNSHQAIGVAVIGMVAALLYSRFLLWPRAVFLIGHGRARHEQLGKFRTYVLGTVFLGTALAVASNYLSSELFGT
ncbi:MAG: hypothetical protein K2P94_03635 [Rhodospirillaceae bacterium]|nr:hypothetical protein [Rhodospirillaceae bacterium]